jgi:hypothetical protein
MYRNLGQCSFYSREKEHEVSLAETKQQRPQSYQRPTHSNHMQLFQKTGAIKNVINSFMWT